MNQNEDYLKNLNSTNLFTHGPVSFVILGCWDSKRGPVVKNLWYVQKSKTDSLDTIGQTCTEITENGNNENLIDYLEPTKFVVGYILSTMLNGGDEPSNHEDSYTRTFLNHKTDLAEIDNSIKFKFIINENHKLMAHGFLYNAPTIDGSLEPCLKSVTPHCLCFIFPLRLKNQCLVWHPIINNFMNQHLPYLRIIHKKGEQESVITDYTVVITYLIGVLRSLNQFSFSNVICLKKTLFSTSNTDKIGIGREFLSTAIMSHLITFGRSLVIGNDINLINTMIRTLSIFLPPDKRELCVELTEKEQINFSSDIMVQGLCKNNIFDVDYTFWSVVSGSYPLTVINLNSWRVMHSGNYTNHKWMQYLMHENLLKKLYLAEKCPPIKLYLKNISINLDFILKDGSYPGELCKSFVKKITNVSGCRRKLDVFNIFMSILMNKAKLLIAFTKQYISCKKDSVVKNRKISKSIIQDACQIKYNGDFLIVLAFAEQLCPGIYSIVLECPSEKIGDMSHMFTSL